MKNIYLIIFNFFTVFTVFGQVVLTGNIKLSDVPAHVTAPLGTITSVEQFNARITAGKFS